MLNCNVLTLKIVWKAFDCCYKVFEYPIYYIIKANMPYLIKFRATVQVKMNKFTCI